MVLPLTCFTMLLPRTITDFCSYLCVDLVGVSVVSMDVFSGGGDLISDVGAGDDAPAAALAITENLGVVLDDLAGFCCWAFDLFCFAFCFPVCDCDFSPVFDGIWGFSHVFDEILDFSPVLDVDFSPVSSETSGIIQG